MTHPDDIPHILRDGNMAQARLGIWNRLFQAPSQRLRRVTLQKIAATEAGQLVFSVYRPGDDKSVVIFDLSPPKPGIKISMVKPTMQQKPNTLVQLCRKYIGGRRVTSVSFSSAPAAFIIEFSALAYEPETKEDKELAEGPRHLIFDLESRPARLCLAKKWLQIPTRYKEFSAAFENDVPFFESFCEWSLDATKTKRRATFDVPLWEVCVLPSTAHEVAQPQLAPDSEPTTHPKNSEGSGNKEQTESLKNQDNFDDFSLHQALALLPTHIRRAAKTKIQFFERRLFRQRQDLPHDKELVTLKTRAELLRANLYLWPKDAHSWHLPPDLLSHGVLPPVLHLRSREKPSDVLEEAFKEHDRLERRRKELLLRIADGEKTREEFVTCVRAAGWEWLGLQRLYEAEAMPAHPPANGPLATLLLRLEIPFRSHNRRVLAKKEESQRKLPYRSFVASSGEFMRVARSAADGDQMLRLMPAHHLWLHILTGEGSHVWLEHPKGHPPSPAAQREASILAVHYSKMTRSLAGDVRYASRASIEKRKDLPPGKVIIRRAETHHVKFEKEELELILASGT